MKMTTLGDHLQDLQIRAGKNDEPAWTPKYLTKARERIDLARIENGEAAAARAREIYGLPDGEVDAALSAIHATLLECITDEQWREKPISLPSNAQHHEEPTVPDDPAAAAINTAHPPEEGIARGAEITENIPGLPKEEKQSAAVTERAPLEHRGFVSRKSKVPFVHVPRGHLSAKEEVVLSILLKKITIPPVPVQFFVGRVVPLEERRRAVAIVRLLRKGGADEEIPFFLQAHDIYPSMLKPWERTLESILTEELVPDVFQEISLLMESHTRHSPASPEEPSP